MKVRELIAALEYLDQELEVEVASETGQVDSAESVAVATYNFAYPENVNGNGATTVVIGAMQGY